MAAIKISMVRGRSIQGCEILRWIARRISHPGGPCRKLVKPDVVVLDALDLKLTLATKPPNVLILEVS
jgi:hypothetical protein